MKVLYIGGTGEISYACVLESLDRSPVPVLAADFADRLPQLWPLQEGGRSIKWTPDSAGAEPGGFEALHNLLFDQRSGGRVMTSPWRHPGSAGTT